MGHLKMSLAHTSNLITPVAAKEQRRAQRLTSQAASAQQRELAWGQASSQRDQHARYLMQQQRGAKMVGGQSPMRKTYICP